MHFRRISRPVPAPMPFDESRQHLLQALTDLFRHKPRRSRHRGWRNRLRDCAAHSPAEAVMSSAGGTLGAGGQP
jgi:hypothetical protein